MASLTNGQAKTRRGFEWTRVKPAAVTDTVDVDALTDAEPELPIPGARSSWWIPRGGRLRFVLLGSDALAVALAWFLVLFVGGTLFQNPWPSIALMVGVVRSWRSDSPPTGASIWRRVNTVRSAELAALLRIAVIVSVVGWFSARGKFGASPWWVSAVIAGMLTFLFLAASRSAFDAWIKSRRRAGAYCRRIVLVGRDEAAVELLELVEDQPELGYRIVGFVGPRFEADEAEFPVNWVADYADLKETVADREANGVIVAASALGERALRSVLCDLVEAGVHVQVSTGLQGLDHRRLRARPPSATSRCCTSSPSATPHGNAT